MKSAYRREFKKTYVKNNNLLSDAKLFTKIYQAKKTLKSDSARKYASDVIHNRKKSNTVKLYDIPSFAKLFILSEIWNDRHVLNYMNTRFYFNPYSLKLEPISQDQGRFHDWKKGVGGSTWDPLSYQLYREILSSSEYTRSFKSNYRAVKEFQKVTEIADYWASFFQWKKK